MSLGEPVWARFVGGHGLPGEDVHVLRSSLGVAASGMDILWETLSPDERQRADRFHFEVDRRRCIIGRGVLRLLLGQILGLSASQLQFECDEFGKPRLMPRQGLPLQFNVSHSGDLILIAIAMGRAVGVDVERIRADIDLDSIAARFFSPNECRMLASLAEPVRHESFFACWTRKEAYLKAKGVGLSLPLDQFDVSFLPGEEPRLLEVRHDPAEARRWTLRTLDPGCGYVAALAAEGSDWRLKCWDWPSSAIDGFVGNCSRD
jgi:4'-phosphopantetheinyl transferase